MQVQNDDRPNTIAVGYRLTSVDVQKLKEIRQALSEEHGARLSKTQVIKMMINQIHLDLNLRA